MADYSHYSAVADEWKEFEKSWNPPAPPSGASLQEVRDIANAGSAKIQAAVLGKPEDGLTTKDVTIPTTDGETISLRLYIPRVAAREPLPAYISFHGGGFYLGNLETEDPWCRQVVLNTGLAVLNVNYRHTPEHVFPAPVHDAWAAYAWLQAHGAEHHIDPSKVYVGGVSAGASLAISVALRALKESQNPVKGLIPSFPMTVHPDHFPMDKVKDGRSSFEQNKDAPFINAAKLVHLCNLYKPEPAHPSVSPLLLPNDTFSGLSPTSIYVSGNDPLRDEGLLFEEKLRRAGVQTKLKVYAGLPHSIGSLPKLPSAADWRRSVQDDLKALVNQQSLV